MALRQVDDTCLTFLVQVAAEYSEEHPALLAEAGSGFRAGGSNKAG